uniref:Uncharacterized protein n=1 Tax=Megaselia scalaris TaxID=36166 RepID=T1GZT0_MEGSC
LKNLNLGTGRFSLRPKRSFTGNIAQNWKEFQQRFEVYLLASGNSSKTKEKGFEVYLLASRNSNKTEEVKIAIMLHTIDEKSIQIFQKFVFEPEGDKEKLIKLENESFQDFLTAIRTLLANCEYLKDDVMLRDRIVLGINSEKIQE